MKHPLVHAIHVLECIEKLEEIYRKDPDFDDEFYYDAVLRNLQTMAESTAHVDEDIRVANPHIRWKAIWGLRNILVHDYLGDIDAIIVTNILTTDLKPLKLALESVVPDWKELKQRFNEANA